MEKISIRTLNETEGKDKNLPDYWVAWANGVKGDGVTKDDAIANTKARLAAGEKRDHAQPHDAECSACKDLQDAAYLDDEERPSSVWFPRKQIEEILCEDCTRRLKDQYVR